MNPTTNEMQYSTLMPEGVDVSIEVVDHTFNEVYKSSFTFTEQVMEKNEQDLDRYATILFMIKEMLNDKRLHKC